jgi:hypothetical protein
MQTWMVYCNECGQEVIVTEKPEIGRNYLCLVCDENHPALEGVEDGLH